MGCRRRSFWRGREAHAVESSNSPLMAVGMAVERRVADVATTRGPFVELITPTAVVHVWRAAVPDAAVDVPAAPSAEDVPARSIEIMCTDALTRCTHDT
jgi:hypothetical protein